MASRIGLLRRPSGSNCMESVNKDQRKDKYHAEREGGSIDTRMG